LYFCHGITKKDCSKIELVDLVLSEIQIVERVTGETVKTYGEGDMPVDGDIKLELDVSEEVDEAAYPVIVEPVLIADISTQNGTRRRSGRTAKKRSILLPGELEADVARATKYQHVLPTGDGMEDGAEVTISQVIEVKLEDSQPRKKRNYRRRKPAGEKSSSAVIGSVSGSVDVFLDQLMNEYCGTDGHPADCEDCKSRVQAIRALLQSSEKCHQDTDLAAETAAATDDQEPSGTASVKGRLFSCAQCSDRFDTIHELQKHFKTHAARRKQCKVCRRHLSASTSMISVSSCTR